MEDLELRGNEQITADAKRRWMGLVEVSGGNKSAADSTFQTIKTSYTESHRGYHNLTHILNVLDVLEGVKEEITDFTSVSYAVWFHDVVYKPAPGEDEGKSAELSQLELGRLGIPQETVNRVSHLILLTKNHQVEGGDNDAKLFLDADMSILGADGEVYDKYAWGVTREFGHIDPELFRKGRARVLEGFLARPRIFLTDVMRDRFEQKARANIEREIQSIKVNQ